MLIDSHCHLHDRDFFTTNQAEEMLKKAREAGIEKIVCIGTSHEDSLAARDFANAHDDVYWTYGIHPEHAKKISDFNFVESLDLRSLAGNRPYSNGQSLQDSPTESLPLSQTASKTQNQIPLAIGEVGLDYHYEGYSREAQIKLFECMLQLATDNNLPLSFHVREAFDDFFPVVANFPTVKGVVHSFTDSKKVLKRILNETDFFIGVNGLATYSTLPTPPLERILLETDAPFLAPVPYRGEINQPAYIAEIASWLAKKIAVSKDEVARITTKNTTTLFSLTF